MGVHTEQPQGKQMITDYVPLPPRTVLSHITEQRLCPLFPHLARFSGRGNKINYDLIGKGRKNAVQARRTGAASNRELCRTTVQRAA
jgi:hypothetical protein